MRLARNEAGYVLQHQPYQPKRRRGVKVPRHQRIPTPWGRYMRFLGNVTRGWFGDNWK